MIDFSTLDFGALNSATKYPPIPTYHALDPKNGSLIEDQPTLFIGDVVLTEKVDGTNGRIVLMPDGDYFIGSREDLLYANGDRMTPPAPPSREIVEALKPLAERLKPRDAYGQILVFFLEVYGRKIGGSAKQYTGDRGLGYRLFDIACVLPDVLEWERERISSWREEGGQRFCTEATLQRVAEVDQIPLTPRLGTVSAEKLPTTVKGMYEWLEATLPGTHVVLDEKAGGRAEGIVLRSLNRSAIAKARFQDYARTLKRRNQPKKATSK